VTSRLLPLLAAALALGGCNAHGPTASTSPARYASLDAALDPLPGIAPGLAGSCTPERRASAVVALPAWIGRPTRLRERDEAGAFAQTIVLGSTPRGDPGENAIRVGVWRSGSAPEPLGDGSLDVPDKPTEAGIRAEMADAFPGIAMQVVTRPAANAYGPYGLAIGRNGAGARCLYAWQWIAAAPALDAGQDGAAPMSLRVRLCRADITLEAMAAAVNQLRIVPRFAGHAVAESPSAPNPHATGPRRRIRSTPDAIARAEPVARREFAAAGAVAASPSAVDPAGRRYLGVDTPTVAAPPVDVMRGTLAGLGGGAPSTGSGILAADLPPEAYRGPAGPSTR